MPVKDITGVKFGKLVVLSLDEMKNRTTYWRCRCECGCEVVVRRGSLRQGNTKSCGCIIKDRPRRHGEKSSNWKGGRRLDNQGYVWVRVADPTAYKNRTRPRTVHYESEHIVVMSRMLGRRLHEHENIHHINGNRSDNTPENLELWSTSQPRGQRVDDKVWWAVELLKTYKPELLVGDLDHENQ